MVTATNCRAVVFGCRHGANRPQIFRFLLASMRGCGPGRDADAGLFPEGAPELGKLQGRVERDDVVDADRVNLQKDHWRNRRMQFWRRTQTNAVGPGRGQRMAAEPANWVQRSSRCWATEQVGRDLAKRSRGIERAAENGFSAVRYVERAGVEQIAQAAGV